MQRIVIVAHKYLSQPDDELVAYLNARRAGKVLHIFHSFPDAPDRCSLYRLYVEGELVSQGRTRDYRSWSEPLIYLKELFFTVKWTVQMDRSWERYIGMDGLCASFGNLLRAFGRVKSTVFWAIDFVPDNRFKSGIKNLIYRAVNKHACLHSDEMWDLSPRMADARAKFAGIVRSDYRKHKVVPYGVWLERIPRRSYDECERQTLVFMGHLLEKQGAQLVIKAMPRILEKLPGFNFKIIGGGRYRNALEDLANQLGVASHCRFLGQIKDNQQLEREIAQSAVAIAPYIRALDTWTLYADPGKVKTYLACGVPVLLTDVPWNAQEIEQHGCGKVIPEDVQEIADKIIALLDREENQQMRRKAIDYASGFDYTNIFAMALPEISQAKS
jgi:glycosyltransferase involved in cell wall biosynthesis